MNDYFNHLDDIDIASLQLRATEDANKIFRRYEKDPQTLLAVCMLLRERAQKQLAQPSPEAIREAKQSLGRFE